MKAKKEKPTFTLLGMGVPKLLQLYFKVTMSDAFWKAADEQLTRLFQEQTSIPIKDRTIWIGWNQDDPFHYEKGETSKLKAILWLKYGSIPVFLCWRSASGRIINMSDTDVDGNDLQCWWEGLDIERTKFLNKPVWSLFPFPETAIEMFKRENPGKDISLAFVRCADAQLTPLLEKMVGFKVNKEVCINLHTWPQFSYVRDTISRLAVTLYINHNWNHGVLICWRSKSGKLYDIADTAIDAGDIVFWLEGTDPALYHKQMYPNKNK